MLSVFIGILTVLMVVVSILLVLIVLMQRPKQEGLGAAFGGGMMDSLAGAHTTDVLQKATTWLATIFLVSAVVVSMLTARELKVEDPGELLPAVKTEPELPPSFSDLPMPPAAPGETPAPAKDSPDPAPKAETPQSESKPDPAPNPGEPESAPAKTPAPDADKPKPDQ